MKMLNAGCLVGLRGQYVDRIARRYQAQSPEEFYKGNTLTLVVSAAPGGAAMLRA